MVLYRTTDTFPTVTFVPNLEIAPLDTAPIHVQFQDVADIQRRFRLLPEEAAAVEKVYRLGYSLFAPYVTSVVREIYAALHRDMADASAGKAITIAPAGRDSHAISAAAAGLYPHFHAELCKDVLLSRVVLSAAYRDGVRSGRIPSPPPGTRVWPHEIFKEKTFSHGDFDRMHDYLTRRGVGLEDGDKVVVLDWACGNGTVQEYLTLAYPNVDVSGHYFITSLGPADTHADAKHGHVLHGGYIDYLGIPPPRFALDTEAIWIPENLLSGPWGTAEKLGPHGPVQRLEDAVRANRSIPVTLDPSLYGPFREWRAWAAGKAAALMAVHDYAHHVRVDGAPVWDIAQIRRGNDPLSRVAHAWTFPVLGLPVPKEMREIFDAYVPRGPLTKKQMSQTVWQTALRHATPEWRHERSGHPLVPNVWTPSISRNSLVSRRGVAEATRGRSHRTLRMGDT